MSKKIGIVLLLLCFSVSSFAAKSVAPHVFLESIHCIKSTEKHGDELYLTVTSFPTKGKPKHRRLPEYPLFWPGRAIDKVQKLLLWNEKVNDGQGVRILVSLIEQDSPPWNLDDEIGSVSLKLYNNKGRIDVEWERPNVEASKKVSVKSLRNNLVIKFSGKGQTYDIALKITEK